MMIGIQKKCIDGEEENVMNGLNGVMELDLSSEREPTSLSSSSLITPFLFLLVSSNC